MEVRTANDIYWSREKTSGLSYVPGVDLDIDGNQKKQFSKSSNLNERSAKVIKSKGTKVMKRSTIPKHITTSEKLKPVSLKDLCPEDKERVANLVRELAKAGEEKEATENQLNNERKQFIIKIEELKADKAKIEEEQKSLLLEFKESQRLLVFYQQKITEEQKEVARKIDHLLTEPSFNKAEALNSSRKAVSFPDKVECDALKDITVKEIDGTNSSQRSASDTLSDTCCGNTSGTVEKSFQSTPRVKFGKNIGFTSLGSYSKDNEVDLKRVNDTSCCSAEDDDNQTFSDAFERRIQALSPNGRREVLLKQKHRLEVEQAQLQIMLAEQEEILRYRQKELKKRHVEYRKRMHHFKQSGMFPSAFSDLTDGDMNHKLIKKRNLSKETNYDSTPRTSIGSSRSLRSTMVKPSSEPVLRSKNFFNFSSAPDSENCCTTVISPSHPSGRESGLVGDISSYSPTRKDYPTSNLSLSKNQDLSNTKTKIIGNQHNISLLSQSDLSVSTRSQKRRAHNTMSNITTLSDLVSSVEDSVAPISSHPTSPYSSHSASAQPDDVVTSMTFDTEDSKLLEEIFFIN